MAIYTLTARIIHKESGQVRDVRQAPFLVLEPGQSPDSALAELEEAILRLDEIADDIRAARFDSEHRHHHWWVP
jgi:hypothetical protein